MHQRTLCLLAAVLTVALGSEVDAQRRRTGDLRIPDKLRQGDVAPDFTLKSPDGKSTVTLSQFRGQKPVALVFGSYT